MPEYLDRELDILEQAYSREGGIKLIFKDTASLMAYRMKLYRRRIEDRRQIAIAYNRPMVMGLSPYDVLMFLVKREPDGRPSIHLRRGPDGLEVWDKDGEPIEILDGDLS